jgi:hypothetical protein
VTFAASQIIATTNRMSPIVFPVDVAMLTSLALPGIVSRQGMIFYFKMHLHSSENR